MSCTKIDFNSFGSLQGENPLCYGGKLYLNNDELTELTIPKEVSKIHHFAFYGCKSITKVTIGNHVTFIGTGAFASCSSLTSITIPDNVISLESEAFADCSSLTSVIIGNGVNSIGGFGGCPSLNFVSIGKNVKDIGHRCFYDVQQLECYCYAATPPSLGDHIFYAPTFNRSASTLYVPARCGSAYKTSTWGQYFINIKEMD